MSKCHRESEIQRAKLEEIRVLKETSEKELEEVLEVSQANSQAIREALEAEAISEKKAITECKWISLFCLYFFNDKHNDLYRTLKDFVRHNVQCTLYTNRQVFTCWFRRSRVQVSSDAARLIFGLHCSCVFCYLSKPLKVYITSLRTLVLNIFSGH